MWLLVISIFISSFAPLTTDAAGLFSLFTKETDAKELAYQHNSQTLPLLNPTISPTRKNKLADASNDIDDDALVAKTGPLGTEADISDFPASDTISVYKVRSGDTLPQIAKMFGVSVNTILWANDLPKNTTLKPGQTLVILPVSGVQYTVKKGDTIAKIAKNLNADQHDIEQFNGLDDETGLKIGETIIVPNGEIKDAPKPKPKSSSSFSLTPNTTVPQGYYLRPVRGCTRTQGLHGKNSVDLGCPIGTPIYAAASGSIIVADGEGYNGGYGKYVVIQHPNGTQTLYSHMSSITVSPGQNVNQGDVIGVVGNTGHSTGPHLHWEVRGATNPIGLNARYGL